VREMDDWKSWLSLALGLLGFIGISLGEYRLIPWLTQGQASEKPAPAAPEWDPNVKRMEWAAFRFDLWCKGRDDMGDLKYKPYAYTRKYHIWNESGGRGVWLLPRFLWPTWVRVLLTLVIVFFLLVLGYYLVEEAGLIRLPSWNVPEPLRFLCTVVTIYGVFLGLRWLLVSVVWWSRAY